ncbi:hypothetical protein ACFX15_039838 [Malus domestica]
MVTSIVARLEAIKFVIQADMEPSGSSKRPFTRPSILFDAKEAADIDSFAYFSLTDHTISSLMISSTLRIMACDMDFVKYEEERILNPRGMKLLTCRWLPKKTKPKALIFICHGYAMKCSITMKNSAIRLVKVGFAVYGIDFEGHG